MKTSRLPGSTVSIAAALISLGACQTILDLERAQIDPALTAKSETTEPPEEAEMTSEPLVVSDAGSGADQSSSAPAPQCQGFDNARVGLLRQDGTLPPLPDSPTLAN